MRSSSACAIAVIAASSWLAAVQSAAADTRPSLWLEHQPAGPRTSVYLELGWFTDSDTADLHLLMPQVGVRHAFTPDLELEVDWPFAFADVDVDGGGGGGQGDSAFITGNPLLALYFTSNRSDGYLRGGFGLAPPLANIDPADTDFAEVIALGMSLATHGGWDVWLYAPDRLSLVAPLQLEHVTLDGLLVGLDAALAVVIPTGDAVDTVDGNDDVDVPMQLAGILGGVFGDATVGARLQLFWMPTADDDNASVAVVPFAQVDFQEGGFAYLKFLLNLDEPFGVFGDGAEAWALTVGGGAHF